MIDFLGLPGRHSLFSLKSEHKEGVTVGTGTDLRLGASAGVAESFAWVSSAEVPGPTVTPSISNSSAPHSMLRLCFPAERATGSGLSHPPFSNSSRKGPSRVVSSQSLG